MVAQEEVERTLEVTLFHGRISQEENVVVGKGKLLGHFSNPY